MKTKLIMLALFAALTANKASAQYSNRNSSSDQVISRTDDPTVYTDAGGQYHMQTIEHRVWIPEYQAQGVLGIGKKTVPGHYEMRTDRIKVYNNSQYNQNGQKQPGWVGKHPHGMPPGQRKKLEQQGNVYNYPNGYPVDQPVYNDGKANKKNKQKGRDESD